MRYPHEAWGKELSDLAARFKSRAYLVGTGKVSGLCRRQENAIVFGNSPFLYGLFLVYALIYSRIGKLSMLECSPDTRFFTWLSAMMKPKNTAYRIKSFSWIDVQGGPSARRLAKVLHRFALVIVQDAACYEAVIAHIPKDRVAIVPPGIDLTKYPPSPPPAFNGESLNILFASAPVPSNPYPDIFKHKGIDILLRSVSLLERDGQNVKLLFACRDAYVAELKALIEATGCRRVDVVDGPTDMTKLYQRSHCTIFPAASSRFSPCFPSSIMESLSIGRPVVTTDVVHASELVKRSRCGVVCEPSAEGLAGAITELADNYEMLCQNCLRTARENFDIRRTFETLQGLLQLTDLPDTGLSRGLSRNDLFG